MLALTLALSVRDRTTPCEHRVKDTDRDRDRDKDRDRDRDSDRDRDRDRARDRDKDIDRDEPKSTRAQMINKRAGGRSGVHWSSLGSETVQHKPTRPNSSSVRHDSNVSPLW